MIVPSAHISVAVEHARARSFADATLEYEELALLHGELDVEHVFVIGLERGAHAA